MATSKLLSSISYNSEIFLKQTLDMLIYTNEIQYYEFIKHKADTDGKKDHYHFIMFPNKRLDKNKLRDFFIEKSNVDENGNPAKCQPFNETKDYGDWYWYSIHDNDYLKAKQLKRNFSYKDNDVYSSDKDYHFQLVIEHPLIDYCRMSDMNIRNFVVECVYNDVSLESMLSNDFIPLGKTQSAILLYNALLPTHPKEKNKKNLIDNDFNIAKKYEFVDDEPVF